MQLGNQKRLAARDVFKGKLQFTGVEHKTLVSTLIQNYKSTATTSDEHNLDGVVVVAVRRSPFRPSNRQSAGLHFSAALAAEISSSLDKFFFLSSAFLRPKHTVLGAHILQPLSQHIPLPGAGQPARGGMAAKIIN